MFTTWEHYHSPKLGFRANESKTYLRIWADFFWKAGIEPHTAQSGGRTVNMLVSVLVRASEPVRHAFY
jgi:hypothetical protein